MRILVLALVFFAFLGVSAEAREPNLYHGEKLVEITLPPSGKLIRQGWTRDGKAVAYRLKVKAGTKLQFSFRAYSHYMFLVIFDLNGEDPETAIFSSDEQRLPARITAEKDMDLLIRPYYSKLAPRRGLGSRFVIEINRLPSAE